MSSKARHFDYSPDEYITGVAGRLRADEQGVYWMICSLIMSEGGPVDYDERRFATLCLVRPVDIRRIVDHLVDLNKLIRSDGKLGCDLRLTPALLRPRQHIWAVGVFERDDFTCQYCGKRGGDLECDHVIPVARGGGHETTNLVTACAPCNRSKRDRTPEEWLQ